MIRSLNALLDNNAYTAVILSVLAIFLGVAIATKFDSKWGYVLMLVAALVGLYTLKVNGIFSI